MLVQRKVFQLRKIFVYFFQYVRFYSQKNQHVRFYAQENQLLLFSIMFPLFQKSNMTSLVTFSFSTSDPPLVFFTSLTSVKRATYACNSLLFLKNYNITFSALEKIPLIGFLTNLSDVLWRTFSLCSEIVFSLFKNNAAIIAERKAARTKATRANSTSEHIPKCSNFEHRIR